MNRVSITGSQLRLGLFAGVLVLLCVNALSLWGDTTARQMYFALQAIAGIAVLVCGLSVALRVTGKARIWRLLGVATLLSHLAGDAIWWSSRAAAGGTAPWPAVAAYFLSAALALAALAVLASVGLGRIGERVGPVRSARMVTVIDGLVAALSFVILAVMAGVGALAGAALPRSGNTAVVIMYTAIQLVVVVSAVLIATLYRRDRPYRANFLLLGAGAVMLISSDRVIAYLRTVGFERGDLWGGIGFVLGLLLIAYGMLELKVPPVPEIDRDAMDWLRLLLPYLGFVGTAVLFAFHVLIGRRLNVFLVCVAVVMVALVATRQLIETRSQWLLTRRLYDAQRGLAHQVYHDALTGLPNRLLFTKRLDEAIHRGPFVLIFVDLDDFKELNDRFGHAGGDELLRAVGQRLRRCVGDADTLARIGGDEFAILIDGELELPEVVADRIRVTLRDPFAVHGSSVRVRASMGLVRPDLDEPLPTSDDLLRQADVSMYAGKRVGKDTAVVYRPSLGVSTDFPTALRNANGGIPPGFSLAYQPIVRLPDGTPVAVEALARWTAPNGTEVAPDAFVAAAEAARLGATLDAMVLDLACSEICGAGVDLVLHVNIGAARMGSVDFEQEVSRTLARHGMAPSQLVLEITETVPVIDLADAAAQITRLNGLGVKVALDDFGAGYNSLTYLHGLPVQIIKLDRGLAAGPEPERIVTLYRSVIRLCGELGLGLIAEGIESTAQAEMIYAAGCRLAQGHMFGRALPIAELGLTSRTPVERF
jgi:diguanylate cyclase (GGDEF)-like protein